MATHRFSVRGASPGSHLAGATLGQDHLRTIVQRLGSEAYATAAPGDLVIFDFAGVESVTSSYLKASVLALIRAGQRAADGSMPSSSSDLVINVFPAAAELSTEIREEFVDVLTSQSLIGIEVQTFDGEIINHARILGPADRTVVETVGALERAGASATAAQLMEQNPSAGITVNGWNNRLADLHRLRLARRTKHGRQWIYTAVAMKGQF